MIVKDALYRAYAGRLRRHLAAGRLPRHVALVMDGNRRWARQMGFEDVGRGHERGARHLTEVLGWCADIGVRHVTIYVCSVDNLRKREAGEVGYLMRVIEEVIAEEVARPGGRWQVRVAGRIEVLPATTAEALKRAADASLELDTDSVLTVAVGYDGREEITDAVRGILDEAAEAGTDIAELAQTLTVEDLASHLYTTGQPDPDLVIRTSGERRMSGFLLWQAAYSELYFCDVYWPGFRHVDFLRALRSYAQRQG